MQGDRYSGEFQTIYPERGEIFDRDGHLLAGNRTVYEVGVSLKEVKDAHALAYALSMYLGLSQDEVYNKLVNSPQTWEYVVIQDYVGADTVNSLQEQLKQMFDWGMTDSAGWPSNRIFSAAILKIPWLRTCSVLSRVTGAVILVSRKNITTCWRAIRFRCGSGRSEQGHGNSKSPQWHNACPDHQPRPAGQGGGRSWTNP